MNEGLIIVIVVAISGLAYIACALHAHGLCDMGKVVTLLVVEVGLVTSIFIFIHSHDALKTNASHYEDYVWSAVAGIILFLYSIQQTISMFREVMVKKIAPLQDIDVNRRTEK